MKTCTKCLIEKEDSEFYRNRGTLQAWCKTCYKEQNSNRYSAFKAKKDKKEVEYKKLEQLFKRQLVASAKSRALEQGIPFDLCEDDIVIPSRCPALGFELSLIDKNKYTTPSIDRLIPEKGYTKDNIRIISWRANMLKSNATVVELMWVAEWLRDEMIKVGKIKKDEVTPFRTDYLSD